MASVGVFSGGFDALSGWGSRTLCQPLDSILVRGFHDDREDLYYIPNRGGAREGHAQAICIHPVVYQFQNIIIEIEIDVETDYNVPAYCSSQPLGPSCGRCGTYLLLFSTMTLKILAPAQSESSMDLPLTRFIALNRSGLQSWSCLERVRT